MLDISAGETSMKRRKEKLLASFSAAPIKQTIEIKDKMWWKELVTQIIRNTIETHFFCETRTVECSEQRTERAGFSSAWGGQRSINNISQLERWYYTNVFKYFITNIYNPNCLARTNKVNYVHKGQLTMWEWTHLVLAWSDVWRRPCRNMNLDMTKGFRDMWKGERISWRSNRSGWLQTFKYKSTTELTNYL